MKTRTGFVSNSSSSSFIVAFPKIPKSAKEVTELLFDKDQELFPIDEEELWLKQSLVSKVAETVFKKMKEPISDEEAAEECSYGVIDGEIKGRPKLPDLSQNGWREKLEEHDKKVKEFARNHFEKFRKLNPDAVLLLFHFSDNEGEYEASLEHGDLFRKLPHIQISHH